MLNAVSCVQNRNISDASSLDAIVVWLLVKHVVIVAFFRVH